MDVHKPFHEVVAERLIEQLQAGTAPWQRPWGPGQPHACLPFNPGTGERYKGINAIHLMSQGREDARWMTYRQASAAGAQVRKGEKGTPVQYWKFREDRPRLDAQGEPVLDAQGQPLRDTVELERPRVFYATVFNAEQIDGLAAPPPAAAAAWDGIERAERILAASGAEIRHVRGHGAFYRLQSDSITLPERGQFATADRYYATALHELGHWSGHPTRLGRELAHPFGSEGYAKEELRAEIASMILGEELGIGHDPSQHTAYVGAWLKVLRDDPMEVFRAAAAAEKICEYVLALELQQVQEPARKRQALTGDVDSQPSEMRAAIQQPGGEAAPGAHGGAEAGEALRRYLLVPFDEKDEAKALGARWDRARQLWYVPTWIDFAPFTRWEREPTTQVVPETARTSTRRYLAVPYVERNEAKSAGALWDRAARAWYVGPHGEMDVLARWLPENVPLRQEGAMSPREEFAEAMRGAGLIVGSNAQGDHPILDGQPHRVAVEGGKRGALDGFYVGHLDGHPAGRIINNKTGADLSWKSKGYVLSDEDRAQLLTRAVNKLKRRELQREREQAEGASRVARQMAALVPIVEPTPYLRRKGVQVQAGVMTDQEGRITYIPAFDAVGKLWTVQSIQEDGTKRFAKGCRKTGCFHPVGGMEALASAPVLVIAEGYATAAQLAQALGHATVAAFDSGNLAAVATALRARFEDRPMVIAGDDDRHLLLTHGHNPGREKAQAAAQAVGGRAVFPVFAPGEAEYPATVAAITPALYRAHLLAEQRLAEAGAGEGRLSPEEVRELEASRLSMAQLGALSRMKQRTDFNDLAQSSELGCAAVKRQIGAVLCTRSSREAARMTQRHGERGAVRRG